MDGHPGTIALLTDFGVEDTYVGVMKAVIASRCDARIIDLSHAVPPQSILEAAYLLWTAYAFLPEGTVTVCVVDPGVGTERMPIAVRWPRGHFVGPDNGWLSYVIRDAHARAGAADDLGLPPEWQAVGLDNPNLWLHPTSNTFHGRDIFAPVAASLVSGVALEELGNPLSSLVVVDVPRATSAGDTVQGRVIHVDHFGNLITDIAEAHLPTRFTVSVGGGVIDGPAESYRSTQPLVALTGSGGLLEIAAPSGNASRLINVRAGDAVTVTRRGEVGDGSASG
jgi:S-adenosylmethionine hydrolase